MADQTPFRTEQLRLETGERFVLTVGSDGMPVWWPNLYCQLAIRERALGFSTMQANMKAVCIFHNVCGQLRIDPNARIESLELFREEEIAALREELPGIGAILKRMVAAPTVISSPSETRIGRTALRP